MARFFVEIDPKFNEPVLTTSIDDPTKGATVNSYTRNCITIKSGALTRKGNFPPKLKRCGRNMV